jgi:heme/copper-type cytochrome/quinol oxidase subunit 4
MDKKKNKKEMKWFPGHDLFATIVIAIIVGAVILIKACNG